MRRLTTLLLIISLLVSCGGVRHSMRQDGPAVANRYFSDAARDYVYRTSVKVYGNELGGILIVKKISEDHHRLVLTTEFGNKLLDFSIQKGELTVNSVVEELNRKMLLNVLRDDFQVLVRERFPIAAEDAGQPSRKSYIGKETFEIFSGPAGISKIIRSKRKPRAEYTFQAENDTFAREVRIAHFDIDLIMELKSLE